MSEKELLKYADECMGWAKTARTDKERQIFIEMASTWLRAAALAERNNPSSANCTLPMPAESNAEPL
jgi:hypothetical protein